MINISMKKITGNRTPACLLGTKMTGRDYADAALDKHLPFLQVSLPLIPFFIQHLIFIIYNFLLPPSHLLSITPSPPLSLVPSFICNIFLHHINLFTRQVNIILHFYHFNNKYIYIGSKVPVFRNSTDRSRVIRYLRLYNVVLYNWRTED